MEFKAKGYQIGSTFRLKNKYAGQIEKMIMELEDRYLDIIKNNEPLSTALEELMHVRFNPVLTDMLNEANREAIRIGTQSMADQLNLKVNRDVFVRLTDDYFAKRTYELGKIKEIGDTLKELMIGKAQALFDQDLSPSDIAEEIRKEFPLMADWKANQIAETEIARAADFAGTQMVKESGLDVDAWFLVDPQSCEVCQELASGNPYTLEEAEEMGLPHPNCRDQWAFTLKKGEEGE